VFSQEVGDYFSYEQLEELAIVFIFKSEHFEVAKCNLLSKYTLKSSAIRGNHSSLYYAISVMGLISTFGMAGILIRLQNLLNKIVARQ